MDVIYGSVPMQRLIGILALLRTRFDTTYDRARSALFFYVIVKYGVRSLRHIRARGTLETFREGWSWFSEVRYPQPRRPQSRKADVCAPQRTLLLLLTLPPMAAKVEPQMAQARRDIEKKLIPSGPQVVRYLTLPAEGQPKDWILSEMDRMDAYCHSVDDRGAKLHDWKDGKISGAVYRGSSRFWCSRSSIECMRRRWTGSNQYHRHGLRTLLRFQPITSERVPNYSEDGSRSRVHVFEV